MAVRSIKLQRVQIERRLLDWRLPHSSTAEFVSSHRCKWHPLHHGVRNLGRQLAGDNETLWLQRNPDPDRQAHGQANFNWFGLLAQVLQDYPHRFEAWKRDCVFNTRWTSGDQWPWLHKQYEQECQDKGYGEVMGATERQIAGCSQVRRRSYSIEWSWYWGND